MATLLEKIFKDIPQQFHDKDMIEALIRSYARQMEELQKVFDDLDSKTDIETAVGTVLDHVGSIPGLTRKEAGLLAGIGVEDPVISDERYRQYLKYKVLKNTNECTYRDLMDGLALLWDISPIYYREDESLPATIILTMPFLTPGGKVVTLGEVPMVKAAGVRIEFEYYIRAVVEVAFNFWISSYDIPKCNTIVCGTYPRRKMMGTILAIEVKNNVNSIVSAFETKPAGTIRLGGKGYNATIGKMLNEDIEVEIDSSLQIVNVLKSGKSIVGTNPIKKAKGLLISNITLAEQKLGVEKFSTPASGMQAIGGKVLEKLMPIEIAEKVEFQENIHIALSTMQKCGTRNCGE